MASFFVCCMADLTHVVNLTKSGILLRGTSFICMGFLRYGLHYSSSYFRSFPILCFFAVPDYSLFPVFV